MTVTLSAVLLYFSIWSLDLWPLNSCLSPWKSEIAFAFKSWNVQSIPSYFDFCQLAFYHPPPFCTARSPNMSIHTNTLKRFAMMRFMHSIKKGNNNDWQSTKNTAWHNAVNLTIQTVKDVGLFPTAYAQSGKQMVVICDLNRPTCADVRANGSVDGLVITD